MTATLAWIGADGAYYEMALSARQAARLERGQSVAFYGEPRRFEVHDAIAALAARQDRIRARLGELVTEHPQLKSLRR